jgi:hypothetical protein
MDADMAKADAERVGRAPRKTRRARGGGPRSARCCLARYQAGTALGIELLDASRVLARARLDMAESLVAHNRAQIELLVATGRVERERLIRAESSSGNGRWLSARSVQSQPTPTGRCGETRGLT